MEWDWRSLVWTSIILSPALFLLSVLCLKRFNSSKRPPGPPGWPVFGHVFSLGTQPHRTMAGFQKKYGPVVWLRLGSANTMVVLTAKVAAELFKNHDLDFADRTITETMRSHDYYKGSLALAQYGPYWRVLRRLCTAEMFSNKKINENLPIRRKCIDEMLVWIQKEADAVGEGKGVLVAEFVFLALFNMQCHTVFSGDLEVHPGAQEGSEFFTAMGEMMEIAGHANLSDLVPWLRHFDLQGLRRKMDKCSGKALDIVSTVVEQRIRDRAQSSEEKRKDFLDILLDFEGNGGDEPAKFSEQNIKLFILEIFLTGTETTSTTIEWALTELLRNPEKMIKVKAEIARVIGQNRKLEERDIDDLPYLQAVIKETMRLHPPVPFLSARRAVKDTNFMGYHIPRNTQVFTNTWSIGRDPEFWDDPLSYTPERFLDSNVDYKGQHSELIPFGAGRRICVAQPLAHRLLHVLLGSLLHEFDWELENGITPSTIDMNDKIGVTARKLEPLKAVARKCISL